MFETALGFSGAFTAPHRAAALTGQRILSAGGSAIEAMVAAAATIAVAYPHMNGLGGDAFWVIHRPGQDPIAISGAGRAGALATPDWYARRGHEAIPVRGADAALVVPGAVASWQLALSLVTAPKFSVQDLLADAIALARDGVAVTAILAQMSASRAEALARVPGFADVHLPGGKPLGTGERYLQPAYAATLQRLADVGLDDFYRGDIAATHGRFLEEVDSPLRRDDLVGYRGEFIAPLSVKTSAGRILNMPPPTQGIATLVALALFDRLDVKDAEGFAHVHGLVEATKRAYSLRNRHVGDPDTMIEDPKNWLSDGYLDTLAAGIDRKRAAAWPEPSSPGDTVWMGAADKDGTVVSFIQSLYWDYGSALTCAETGITFENRGAGFSLQPGPNQLAPGKRPFHTLNPGLAQLPDGRVLAFGTQGGEGQPQTMTAIFSRYAMFGQELQRSVTAPRWVLGTTWGDPSITLKLEGRFDPKLIEALTEAGHRTEVVGDFDPMMGHAGAIVRHPGGLMEAATDPRSDGAAIAF